MMEVLNVNLEEVFIYEMEKRGMVFMMNDLRPICAIM